MLLLLLSRLFVFVCAVSKPSNASSKLNIFAFSAVLIILAISLAAEGWVYSSTSYSQHAAPPAAATDFVANIDIGVFRLCREDTTPAGVPVSGTLCVRVRERRRKRRREENEMPH